MTLVEANRILDELGRKTSLSEKEEFQLTETLKFVIEKTGQPRYAEWLGGIYYDKRMFDLALKYYELAESLGSTWAWNGLGYIWYYGRTGTVDYEKAYYYFNKMAQSDPEETSEYDRYEARFKIADMYKNGYFVKKNYRRYKKIIEQLYSEILDSEDYSYGTEVKIRLAAIREKEGETDEAIDLYLQAKDELAYRLSYNRFFGDINRMNWLINDLYKLIDIDLTDFDLYDLFYILKEEHTVTFKHRRRKREIESRLNDEGETNICFDDIWYRNISDFFIKANLGEESIEHEYDYMSDWRIKK